MITIENSIQIGEFSVYIELLTGEVTVNEYSYGENQCLEKLIKEKFMGEPIKEDVIKQITCYVEGYHEGRRNY